MRILAGLFLIVLLGALCAPAQAQAISKDTLMYTNADRVTTAFNSVYLGPKGILKWVYVTFDTTSSTQTASIAFGAVADTGRANKYITFRLAYRTLLYGYSTYQDTVRIKVNTGSVLSSVIASPW